MFVPLAQSPIGDMTFVVRTTAAAGLAAAPVKAALQAVDATQALVRREDVRRDHGRRAGAAALQRGALRRRSPRSRWCWPASASTASCRTSSPAARTRWACGWRSGPARRKCAAWSSGRGCGCWRSGWRRDSRRRWPRRSSSGTLLYGVPAGRSDHVRRHVARHRRRSRGSRPVPAGAPRHPRRSGDRAPPRLSVRDARRASRASAAHEVLPLCAERRICFADAKHPARPIPSQTPAMWPYHLW